MASVIHNLSLQGMFIDSAFAMSRMRSHPGISSPWPSCYRQDGRASCALLSSIASTAGVAWSFWRDIRDRSRIWRAIGLRWRRQHGEVGYGPVWVGVVKPMGTLLPCSQHILIWGVGRNPHVRLSPTLVAHRKKGRSPLMAVACSYLLVKPLRYAGKGLCGVAGVIGGKFTVTTLAIYQIERWPITRCDATGFAVQYGYTPLSM